MDESSLQIVSETGTQLSRLARPNKDFLVKSLRQAANALALIEQPAESSKKTEAVKKLEASLKPVIKSIIKHGLLRHNDKDVKLLVAICVSEIFRILAPELPFEDKYLRDVFKLILSMFAELADTTSPYFSRRVKILETVARCKCFVILLDIGCNDLILEMFNIFFSIVRENHQRSLINDILSIMTYILNEEASLLLSDVILRNLVKEETAASAAASQLAVSVIESCAEKLEPFVCGFLTSCFLDRDAVDSELKEFYHEILFKVFQCAPQMLLAVIPNLTQELLTDQVDVRIKAVNLIGKLFALPGQHVAQKYHSLFVEFINRFSDKSVEVRLTAIRCAKACYMACPSGKESHDLLSALEGRLLDFDDKVRTLAVDVVCDLARLNLKIFPSESLLKVAERLRDKKLSVRKKALQKLMEIYHEYCTKCSEGYLSISNHFEQIPCKILMLCYDKECKEFRSQKMELILSDDLFPACLSVEDRTRHWIHFSSLFTPLHVKALNSILSQKRRLQTEMQSYLALRKKEKGHSSEDMEKKIKSSFMKMAASFPDPCTAEECFHKLDQMKVNNGFNSLEQLLAEQTLLNAHAIRDKFLKMMGDKYPHFEFLQELSSKCSPNIFSSEHVHCILDHLSSDGFGNGDLEASSAKLLLVIITAFPSLLRGFEDQFLLLLKRKIPITNVLIETLAKAGPYISVRLSDVYPFLEKACLEGTRMQAKQAVFAIASLIGSSEQCIFSKLCKELVNSLYCGWNIPTILQSLGCIAQHSVSAFEDQEGRIRSYIFERIFQGEHYDDVASSEETSGCCTSCKMKIYGLKTLVRSFLPHRGSHVNYRIDELLDILLKLLQMDDDFDEFVSCANDKPLLRLAAAKSVLRLSRRWDLYISPEIFRSTILIAKDSSSLVRRTFLNKIRKLLKEHAVPSRYACAFAFAGSSCKDLQDAPFKCMEEFIKEYSPEAQIRQNLDEQGGSITDHPAYVVVFLIHMLAHDVGFPSEDSRDEQEYALFCRPLFWVIQTLLNADVNGNLDIVNEAVMHLLSIFRAIKRAEDGFDIAKTPKLQILAEIGVSIVNALNLNGITLSRAPRMIFLPSSLYKLSSVKKCDEGKSRCPNLLPGDESFVKGVVHRLKSQMFVPASSVPKRGRKIQEDQSARYNTLNLALEGHANLSIIETTKVQKSPSQDISLGRRKKIAASESVELLNEVSKNYESKSTKSILKKGVSSSCNFATTKPMDTSQALIQNEDRTVPLEKMHGGSCSITTESSKYSTAKLNAPCHSKTFSTESETLIGKQLRILSPLDKCFHSGTVVGYNPGNNSHKISYDSGKVELLCLDSESWEILGDTDNSPTEEMTLADDCNTFKSSSRNLTGCSSIGNIKETVSPAGDGAIARSKRLADKENQKIFNGTSFLAKRRKRQKVLSNTSVSEVINLDEDPPARRTRQRNT